MLHNIHLQWTVIISIPGTYHLSLGNFRPILLGIISSPLVSFCLTFSASHGHVHIHLVRKSLFGPSGCRDWPQMGTWTKTVWRENLRAFLLDYKARRLHLQLVGAVFPTSWEQITWKETSRVVSRDKDLRQTTNHFIWAPGSSHGWNETICSLS